MCLSIFNLFKKSNSDVKCYDYNDKEYYLNNLKKINESIDSFNSILKKENDEKNKNRFYNVISIKLLKKIELMHTLKESYENIRLVVEEYIKYIEISGNVRDLTYNEIKNVLSLAYLYNFNSFKSEYMKKNILNFSHIDASLDMLINGFFMNNPTTSKNFCWKLTLNGDLKKTDKEFMSVVNANSKEEIASAFIEYLNTTKENFFERQLKSFEILGDNHIYTGSYDFMLTALAKMMNIDKNMLTDSKFIYTSLL